MGTTRALLYSRDLLFSSRIQGAAAAAGVEVRRVRSAADSEAALAEGPGLLIADLTAGEDVMDLLTLARSRLGSAVRIIGYYPHVEDELAQQARAAGADEAMPRSKLLHRLEGLCRELATTSS